MSSFISKLGGGIHAVETFFDRVKLGYKRRFDRFGPIQIVVYCGFGTTEEIQLKGRVLDDPPIRSQDGQTVWQNIIETIHRIETDEIPGARVRATFLGEERVATTTRDGFFELSFHPDKKLPEDCLWHEVKLELLAPNDRTQDCVRATGYVTVPRQDSEFGIISDLDDTVIRTGATDKLKMARVMLLNTGATRIPFEGVAQFYDALQKGPNGRGVNPIFYISSSPINFYSHFEHFMDEHRIPIGPILLKDFGFSKEKLLTGDHQAHKLSHIEMLLNTYPDLPFVLIGDSGQKDATIYRTAIERYGAGRFRAIYIRDVTPQVTDQRDDKVQDMAEQVCEMGVPMVLVQSSIQAAEHAAEHGLIQPEAIQAVRVDRHDEEKRKKPPSFWKRLIG